MILLYILFWLAFGMAWASNIYVFSFVIPWSYIVGFIHDWFAFINVFWPLEVVQEAVGAYITFRICLLFVNLILGARAIGKYDA